MTYLIEPFHLHEVEYYINVKQVYIIKLQRTNIDNTDINIDVLSTIYVGTSILDKVVVLYYSKTTTNNACYNFKFINN